MAWQNPSTEGNSMIMEYNDERIHLMWQSFQDLSDKFLEIISVSDIAVQREIITAIPEILDDNEHSGIAKELMCVSCFLISQWEFSILSHKMSFLFRNFMQENSQLTIAILDTLTNLNLKSEILSEVGIVISTRLTIIKIRVWFMCRVFKSFHVYFLTLILSWPLQRLLL